MRYPLHQVGSRSSLGLLFFTLIGTLSVDVLTKYVFAHEVGILNTGISFGLGSGFARELVFLTVLVAAGVFCWWQRQFLTNNPVATGLFFGGALANIVDRFLFGGVRDWLKVPGIELYNNVADWAIFFGVLLFFKATLKTTERSETHE